MKSFPLNNFKLQSGQFSYSNLIYNSFYYLLASVLIFSGIAKIIDVNPLIEVLQQIKLPNDLVIVIATILPITEIGLGIMLLLKIKQRTSIKITVILFLVFFLFSVYGMVMGIEKDCGCFGNAVKSYFGWGMVGRNFLLLITTIFLEKSKKNYLSAEGIILTNK
ncbi:MauE/DoxX family redox-associated membrane protein [Melioribacteraceae bacterium 4301-Me]|uniref:MauE/DoxX family redox-associated membrane protein n=1 Tax=Pyranulibacter aquaticus TaxID=3163344 RepID=UPI00359B099D